MKQQSILKTLWFIAAFLLIAVYTLPANATTYTYDDLDRLTSVTYDNGQMLTYTYDGAGNILSINSQCPEISCQIAPDTIVEADDFAQTFTITLNTGSFTGSISTDDIALGGDFSGLVIGDIAKTSPNSITVALSGALHWSTGTGTITISAAGTDAGIPLIAKVRVNSSKLPAANLSALSIKEGTEETGAELISNFDPSNLNITLQTATEVESVKVTVTPAEGTTAKVYQGTDEVSNGVINLNQGPNVFTIVVSEPYKSDKTYTVTVNRDNIEECFIATAAFGSKYTWPVTLLRHFRDQYLLSNAWGTGFVNFYYRHSPPIAAFIADNGLLKILVRVLLAPVIALVYLIYHPIILATILVLLAMVFCYRARAGKRISRA